MATAANATIQASVKPPVARRKASHVGAPAIFALQAECREIARAFDCYGIYLVGSALERPDWRDVDVRLILSDERFERLFPDAGGVADARWEFDPRWSLLVRSVSALLSQRTGLPIDFQFQPQSHANKSHQGRRDCLSMDFEPHPKCGLCDARPVVANLDDDNLCQSCADKWVRAQGKAERSYAQDAAGEME